MITKHQSQSSSVLDFLRHSLISVPLQGKDSDDVHAATEEKKKKRTTVDKNGVAYKQVQRTDDRAKNCERHFPTLPA